MATQIPHTVFTNILSLLGLTPMLTQNFQALNVRLGETVTGHRVTLSGYAATGATTTKMTIGSVSPPGSTPWAVLLVRCRETRNPGADLTVSTRLNFTREGDTLYVFEPGGLVSHTFYDMDFLVLE